MKNYVKPSMESVELRSEERFAEGSGCSINGNCGTAYFTYTDPVTRELVKVECNRGF